MYVSTGGSGTFVATQGDCLSTLGFALIDIMLYEYLQKSLLVGNFWIHLLAYVGYSGNHVKQDGNFKVDLLSVTLVDNPVYQNGLRFSYSYSIIAFRYLLLCVLNQISLVRRGMRYLVHAYLGSKQN